MPEYLDGLLWLLLLLGPLLILTRRLHRETQAIFLLITRRPDIALTLFAIIFFPGVFIHETSHFVMARLLGVRTGRFSLIPQPTPQGRLQLGYVESAKSDWLRDSLIGVAPLVLGGVFVAYAGLVQLDLNALWGEWSELGPAAFLQVAGGIYHQPDFWLWFYLIFAVSSTMLPSPSDRRAWLPLLLVIGILVVLSALAGAGPWMMVNLAPILNRVLQVLAVVFAISVVSHLVLFLPFWSAHRLLTRLTGMEVV
jgi:hypothetical protein